VVPILDPLQAMMRYSVIVFFGEGVKTGEGKGGFWVVRYHESRGMVKEGKRETHGRW
jgi:hypothetical protein